MFKLIGVISNAIIAFITSITKLTVSIDNAAEACNVSSNALLRNANNLDADVAFECEKKAHEREAAMLAYRNALADLTDVDNDNDKD